MQETPEHRLKRLHMRSWRRGTKEMDLILGSFADAELESLNPEYLDMYEALLVENDQDLYPWFNGQLECPPKHALILGKIRAVAKFR